MPEHPPSQRGGGVRRRAVEGPALLHDGAREGRIAPLVARRPEAAPAGRAAAGGGGHRTGGARGARRSPSARHRPSRSETREPAARRRPRRERLQPEDRRLRPGARGRRRAARRRRLCRHARLHGARAGRGRRHRRRHGRHLLAVGHLLRAADRQPAEERVGAHQPAPARRAGRTRRTDRAGALGVPAVAAGLGRRVLDGSGCRPRRRPAHARTARAGSRTAAAPAAPGR